MVSTFVKPAGNGVFCVLQSQPLCVPEEIQKFARWLVEYMKRLIERASVHLDVFGQNSMSTEINFTNKGREPDSEGLLGFAPLDLF